MNGDRGPADPQPKILLVDDDPFMLDLQSRTFARMGYRDVDALASANDALDSLLRLGRPPDIIVCDLGMPGMNGVEFLQALHASPFAGSVILLSGEGAGALRAAQGLLSGLGLRVLGALEKPARPDVLRNLLERWLPVPAPGVADDDAVSRAECD